MPRASAVIASSRRLAERRLAFGLRLSLALSVALLLLAHAAISAPLWNVPQKLVQPDGVVLECLASGDEHFNWLHDSNGYVIIQDHSTGYYTYATKINGELQPSQYIAGQVDPASVGLTPNIKPSAEKLQQMLAMPQEALVESAPANAPSAGTINNLVVFIRFKDESEFTDQVSTYDTMFNSSVSGANSMLNYFKEVSYNTLNIGTTFYPTPPGSTVISYQDSVNTRGYYQPYDATTNPIGYQGGDNGNERTTREQTLLKNAANAIASQVPVGLNLDGDNDGRVDNVCFIISGSATGWASLLWPHMWSLYSQNAYINGKQVYTYNFQLRNSTLSSGVGVLCHEMMHSLGAPDLYHYSYDGISPVGSWDIMESNANPPQHPSAYMKYRYGHWISSIPTISTPGVYTLNPLTSPTGNCYKIASLNSSTEFYVVEYRKRTGTFENSVPGSGLLVYRINTASDGDGNADGPPDEVYIYRPNGTCSANGSYGTACFSSDVGRTAINDTTNPAPFLSTCAAGGLSISEVGSAGSTISFRLGAGGADSYESDNTCDAAKTIQPGVPQAHSIYPATDVDWVKFTLTHCSSVVLETAGASGNTRMWLYSDCGATLVEYNDDGNGLFCRIDRLNGVDPLPAGTYYVKIDESGNDQEIGSYTISLTANDCGLVCSADVPKTIPDLSTIWSDLPVTGSDVVSDVNVKLNITHTYDADLNVYLEHPDGTSVELFSNVGSSADNFTDTILDDEAAANIASGTAPFTGSYRPGGLLSALDGKPMAGTWRLRIIDAAGTDEGVLQSWCLLISTPSGPVVTNIASVTADGSYGTGTPVSIQVTFGEFAYVTGTPQLELETGAIDRNANYASGSGSSTLTFTYTVQPGDNSADLDYTGIGALSLNGGTIRGASGNDANLSLPVPGTAGSLGSSKNIVIDTTAPLAPSTPDLDLLDDTGESDSDDCTRNTTGLTLCGTADIGATVKLWDGATLLGSGTAVGGNYCIDVSILEGVHSITATATDGVGNQSAASAGLGLTVDTTPPVSSVGPLDCGYTAAAVVVPCAVFDAGCGIWHSDLWYRQRPLSGGEWSAWASYGTFSAWPIAFDSATAGGDGEYQFYTVATDKAGNTEAAPLAADSATKILAAGVAAPVLSAEPARTPGKTNEICWISNALANRYQAQCSRDAGFGSIEQDTGWLPRPPDCHTFAGLLAGNDYCFRVRSGMQLCPTAFGAWSQTSQAEFDTGQSSNVSTTASPGDVVLGSIGATAADTVGGATSPSTGGSRSRLNAFQCTADATLTQIEVYLNISASTPIEYGVYERSAQSGAYTRIHSNTVASSGTGQGFYTSGEISVPLHAGKYYTIGAGWSGSVTYYMGGSNTSVAFGQSYGYTSSSYPLPATLNAYAGTVLYNFRLTSDTSGYAPTGALTSAAIAPSPFAEWGILDYTKDESPAGTALTVDILDGTTGAQLLANAASGTDLKAAGVTASSIKLRANLSTTQGANTPILSDWAVSYKQSDETILPSDWSNTECTSQLRVYGAANRSVGDAIMTLACPWMAFTIWGRVTVADAGSFDLDDGSGPVRVVAPGYSLQTGDYASATGILEKTDGLWTLTCEPRLVEPSP